MKIDGCEAFDRLACPVDGSSLVKVGDWLQCRQRHRYPIVEGVPVLLRDDIEQTIGIADQSLKLAREWADGKRDDPWFVDTLGISDEERSRVRGGLARGEGPVDPVVANLIGATNGILYKSVIGALGRIPIPETRLPRGNGQRLIDIGCNWGRWSLAASAKGYHPIGLDPSLGAVLAAQRLARIRGVPFDGIVGDARYLPLNTGAVDAAFSYSVLQHLSKPDARLALRQIARVVRSGGSYRIQMASAVGVRSFQHIARRRFRRPKNFEVRYWLPSSLFYEFESIFGDAHLEVDCYFGLGLQPSDYDLYGTPGRMLLSLSEMLRRTSRVIGPLKYVADSLYVVGTNSAESSSAVTNQ